MASHHHGEPPPWQGQRGDTKEPHLIAERNKLCSIVAKGECYGIVVATGERLHWRGEPGNIHAPEPDALPGEQIIKRRQRKRTAIARLHTTGGQQARVRAEGNGANTVFSAQASLQQRRRYLDIPHINPPTMLI